jgi:hypothetical protein
MKLPLFPLFFSVTFALASAAALSVGACTSSAAPVAPIASNDDSGTANPLQDAAPSAIDSSPLDTGTLPQPVADSSSGADSAALDSSVSSLDSAPAAEDSSAQSSPYAVSCASASSTCPGTPLVCQEFTFGGGAIDGYACTQTCTTTADCGTSPAGFPPVVCQPFTTSSFCVLSCDPTSATSCPNPLKCAADEGQPTGLCVTL